MTHPVSVALLGLGGIAQSVHLPLLQRSRETFDVVSLVDLSISQLNRFSTRYGVDRGQCFTTVDELVSAIENGLKVDAAIIATGGTHVDDVAALASRGVCILAEKPLGYSIRELDRLAESLKAVGRTPEEALRIGYMKEYDPASVRAKDELESSSVRAIHVTVLHPADERQLRFARLAPRVDDVQADVAARLHDHFNDDVSSMIDTNDEMSRKYFTNVFLGSIIHDIALLRYLGHPIGTVDAVRLSGDAFPGSITAHGLTRTGVPWILSWHFIDQYPVYREILEFHHETGTIELEFPTPYILQAPTTLKISAGSPDLSVTQQTLTWPQSESFENEHLALGALVTGNSLPGSTLQEGYDDLVVAHQLWSRAVEAHLSRGV